MDSSLANTTKLVLPSAHLSPQPKRQIDQFSRFCTAHRRKSLYFTMGAPFPRIAPSHGGIWTPSHTIPWDHPSPQPKWHLDQLSYFLHRLPQCLWCPFSPQNCPFPWGSGPPSNTWFPAPTRVLNANGISIGSAVFAGLTSVTDRRTSDHTIWSVSVGHIYV